MRYTRHLALIAIAVSANAAPAAHAQFADSCKDVLDEAGTFESVSNTDASYDMVSASAFAEARSSGSDTGVGGSYAGIKGNYNRSKSMAEAVSRSEFKSLSGRFKNDARLTQGNPEAIKAWLSCKSMRRGPSLRLIEQDARHFQLMLSWDKPDFIDKNGATIGPEGLHIAGAKITFGADCIRPGFLIETKGCLIALERENPANPIIVGANTDFGSISAYAQSALRLYFKREAYPREFPGTGQPPVNVRRGKETPALAAGVILPKTGRDNGGAATAEFSVQMSEQISGNGWVFDAGRPPVAALDYWAGGTKGGAGCGGAQIKNVFENTIQGSVRISNSRGDVSAYCNVALQAQVIKAVLDLPLGL